jgi:hypothetical protein
MPAISLQEQTPMGLKEQLVEDLKTAMKAKDEKRVAAIRMLRDAIAKFELTRPAHQPITEADLLSIVEKQVKQRRESIEMFKQGNRLDLVENESAELAVLEAYLPKRLSRDEIKTEVQAIIAALGTREFPKVMKEAAAKLKGRAEGKLVNEVVRELTS